MPLSYKGFSAWIKINGRILPTYQEEHKGNQCSAWIPSTAGENFSVVWKDESNTRIATSGHLFIDGHDVASAIMRPGRTKPVERDGAKTSSRKVKPFRFSVLELTDDDDAADRYDPLLNEIGTIKVEIKRVKLGAETAFKGYEPYEHGAVHEKAKKMGAHCTSFGSTKRTTSTKTVAVTTAPYDDNDPGPYVVFLFRYRSEDLLRAQGIIPNDSDIEPRVISDGVIVITDSEDEEFDQGEAPPRKKQKKEPEHGNDESSLSRAGSVVTVQDGEEQDTRPVVQEDEDAEDMKVDFGVPSLLQNDDDDGSQTEPEDEDDDAPSRNGIKPPTDEDPSTSGDKRKEETPTLAEGIGEESASQNLEAEDSQAEKIERSRRKHHVTIS